MIKVTQLKVSQISIKTVPVQRLTARLSSLCDDLFLTWHRLASPTFLSVSRCQWSLPNSPSPNAQVSRQSSFYAGLMITYYFGARQTLDCHLCNPNDDQLLPEMRFGNLGRRLMTNGFESRIWSFLMQFFSSDRHGATILHNPFKETIGRCRIIC